MEEEVLQTVVSEMLEELREVRKQQLEAVKLLTALTCRVGEVEAQISAAKTGVGTQELNVFAAAFDAGFDQIKSVVEAQPKRITKQYRLLLSPEYNASEYYKVIGKVFLWLLIFSTSTYLFILGNRLIEVNSTTRQNELDPFKYKKAWIFLYHGSKKSVRQKMDSVWSKNAGNI